MKILGALLFSICITALAEEPNVEGFESFQDPNMIKTAPKRNLRNPANFGGNNQQDYSESTEAKFCYGECDETPKEEKGSSLFDVFQ